MKMSTHPKAVRISLAVLGALIIVAGAGYAVYSYRNLRAQNRALASDLAATRTENAALSDALAQASSTLAQFGAQIGSISSTVGSLQKLADTDPELLKKYSKVYFLNENYVPKGLVQIAAEDTYNGKQLEFLGDAYPFLTRMLSDAKAAGVDLLAESAYRSYGTQSELKSAYSVTYGAGTANSFSADQGYSEHQLGTALDFTTQSLKGGLTGFDKTPAYAWLTANAYKYGFILSYPAGNSYYIYEPWHWRFVGAALALRLHEERENFYDLDQRQLDPYLITLFDPLQ